MRILFLNQYFPPDPAPTGVLLREVADAMEGLGHTVNFVAARQEYRAGQQQGGRLLREAKALFRMLLDGLRHPRADVVLSASSPPCLVIVATLIAFWHRARSVHWIMDLYPEIAVAVGEIPAGPARVVAAVMGWCYRAAERVIVLDEDMAEQLRKYRVEPAIIRPWVFASVLATPLPEVAAQAPWTWIYSGNLGRAHEWESLLAAQALIEARDPEIRLLFQGGGPARAAAQRRAAELQLQRCEWAPYVDESELPRALLAARVCVVTQLAEVRGCLWPSKLGFVLTLPRLILWVGPRNGATARLLAALPNAGVFTAEDAPQIADWLLTQKAASAANPLPAVDGRAHREAALRAWTELLCRPKS